MAQKKVEAAEIIIKTTDGGSFKIFGQKAKKATKQVDDLGKASQSTDRRIKGVTQQSSNATKNFSKQAQTMQGGIVAVYATIAAQVFAVSAAFQFLKSSMETRNLIEGQKAFGAITGVAYKTLTNDLQMATEGMLDFKAAASSVAIGTASGLSASQMTSLGVAAKNASMALGRDLTDSFNRLVRGVTKAEPELLDELGIVLRLENATRDYAQSVGKARDDLNAFERTQAVLNDVLEQAEQKFGRITELMDPDAFALGQLTKEIDDLVLGFQELLVKVLLPMISFFKDNAAALVAAIGLFVTPIISSLLPDLDASIAKSSKAQSTALSNMAGSYRTAGQEIRTVMTGLTKITKADISESAVGLDKLGVTGKGADIMETDAKTGKTAKTGYKQLNRRQVAAYRRAIKEKKGIYMKFNAEEKVAFKRHLATQEALLNKSEKVKLGIRRRGQLLIDATYNAGVTVFAAAEAAKLQIAKVGAMAMNAVMSIAGVLGVIAMVIAGGKALFDYFQKGDKAAQKFKKETQEVSERLKSINEEMDRMGKVRDQGLLGLVDGVGQTGKALQSADIVKLVANYNQELTKSGKSASEFRKTELGQQFQEQARQIEKLAPGMKGFQADLMAGAKNGDEYKQIANDIINGAQALERFAANTKSVNKQIEKTIGRMAKLPFQDLMKPLQASVDDFALAVIQLSARIQEMKQNKQNASGLASNFGSGIYSEKLLYRDRGNNTSTSTVSVYDEKARDKAAEQFMNSGAMGQSYGTGLLGAQNMVADLGLTTDTMAIGDEVDMNSSVPEIIKGLLAIDGNAELIAKKFGKSKKELEKMAKAVADAEKELALMELTNETNKTLLQEMKFIQEDMLALEEKKIQNAQTLAEKGVGSGKGVAMAKAQYKVSVAGEKKLKAAADARVAKANKQLEVNKLLDRLQVDGVITADDREKLLKNETELLSIANGVTGESYKTQVLAVTNGKKAVANADKQVTLQDQLFKNAGEQLTLDQAKINIQFIKLDAIREELRLKGLLMNIDNNLATSNKYGFGSAAEKHKAKGDKITAKQNINANKQTTNLSSIQQHNASFTAGMDPLVAMQGLDINADNYQELVKLYSDRVNLQQESTQLSAQHTKHTQEASKFVTDQLLSQTQLLHVQRIKGITLNPAEQLFNEKVEAHLVKYGDLEEFNIEKTKQLAIEQASLNIEVELMNGIQDTLSNGFVSMFQTMVDGTKSFKDGMKDLAKSVLSDLAAMFAKAAALKIMMAMFPGMGGMMEGISSIPGMGRYGGEMTKYRGGGIASGPNSGYMAMLHGREAVVPLGNDRSIPVDMRGMPGAGNVVTVNITMNGQGQGASQVTGDGMQGLGRSIGNMVQQHLQQEMRPGGLLNAQGTKGRS
jgi:hypothetical protein